MLHLKAKRIKTTSTENLSELSYFRNFVGGVRWGGGGEGQGTKVPLLRSSSLILVFSSSLVPLDDKFLVSRISVICPKVMFSGLGQGPVSCRKSCNQRQIQTKS